MGTQKMNNEQPEIDKSMAYKIVLKDLMEVDMFCGKYDAKNGNQSFMYGVSTVMENIAGHVSDECADEFSEIFFQNMTKSEEAKG